MSGFKPSSSASDIYADHHIKVRDVKSIAEALELPCQDDRYSADSTEKIIKFAAWAKENNLSIPKAIEQLGRPNVSDKQVEAGSGTFQNATGDQYQDATQDIHDRASATSQSNRADQVSLVKADAQSIAANLLTAKNLLVAHYLQTEEFDDPALAAQVEQSKDFVRQELGASKEDFTLGKLLLDTGILTLTKPPAIEALKSAESSKFLLTGTPN